MFDSLVGFAVLAGLLVLVPGLDTALVLRSTLRGSRATAFATAFGIASGLFIWATVVTLGLAQLLTTYPTISTVLELIGAAYMGWIGVSLLIAAARTEEVSDVLTDLAPTTSVAKNFRLGLFTNLLNPKAAAFYLAVLPQFLPTELSLIAGGLILAAIHAIETMLWFGILITAGSAIRPWLSRPATTQWIDRITGIVLIGFGLRLLLT